ncbi:hypothetical protein AZ78_2976 [Lysobacter capsici AZ78]|uniref:Uncharacterized protein n=1 Tax=Lysobacter capsici AZ78 TaxID=1444315 RepID=A0A108UA88_9GAMM|nr:hypothetical protein AZ78_2976 [Lysobacter capsici AZ78]
MSAKCAIGSCNSGRAWPLGIRTADDRNGDGAGPVSRAIQARHAGFATASAPARADDRPRRHATVRCDRVRRPGSRPRVAATTVASIPSAPLAGAPTHGRPS